MVIDRERDEQQRQEFEEKLKARKRSEIVYVDEAGIDNREDYPSWVKLLCHNQTACNLPVANQPLPRLKVIINCLFSLVIR